MKTMSYQDTKANLTSPKKTEESKSGVKSTATPMAPANPAQEIQKTP